MKNLVKKATSLFQQGRKAPARAVCRKIIHTDPTNYHAHLMLGVMQLTDHPADAAVHLRIAAKHATDTQAAAQAYNNLALALGLLSQHNAALDALNCALNAVPQHPLFLCNRANTFEQLQQWVNMEADLRAALQLDSNLSDARVSLAVALRQQNKLSEAFIHIKHASLSSPEAQAEYLLLLWLAQKKVQVREYTRHLTPDRLRFCADYASEQQQPALATELYHDYLQHQPDDITCQFQLKALQNAAIERAPADYIQTVFNQCAGQFETHLVNKLGYSAHQQIAELAYAQLCHHTDAWVLDLGCGTGLVGRALHQMQPTLRINGVDLSENMLAIAQSLNIYTQLIHNDISFMLENAQLYHTITAADTVIYFGALETLFAQVSQALVPQGCFVLNTEKWLGQQQGNWQLTTAGRYQHHPNYVVAQAQRVGLTCITQTETVLRHENHQPVYGNLFTLQKQ